ncbi:YbaK/EbsC family protein [Streptacidiphilus jiangxiensis]|uniref:Cys-tRNA(Pro) deacylase, prolyl-tRNA editing enzyme YbaK/EbsC n=1 Tax=Streptacidiphilus jiangxiensis TaxID=235985 RepID=A0A1H7ZLW0_STRJI|nr:YbaK/EbsC family protein [Streptacidiphilus jiangxiensis]SEM59241.1 Cys-tRNA(Pro) deacylase, prolyl-tRNA editing enzyme YbaK/EbsC [Streptacidiphilus jiangxiensis]
MSDHITPPFGSFPAVARALDVRDELAGPVAETLAGWGVQEAAEAVLYVDTDPEKADTAVFCETYDAPPEYSANCVVVAARRGGEVTMAACVVLATTRLDVNGAVRKHLGARKASFAPMDAAVAETGMEYGGITPLGLPGGWPLLIDEAVAAAPHVLVGSGRRRGKLILPGRALAALPGAEVVPGLAVAAARPDAAEPTAAEV